MSFAHRETLNCARNKCPCRYLHLHLRSDGATPLLSTLSAPTPTGLAQTWNTTSPRHAFVLGERGLGLGASCVKGKHRISDSRTVIALHSAQLGISHLRKKAHPLHVELAFMWH